MVKGCSRILLVFALIASMARMSFAQDTIPFVPSPMHVVHKMLEVAEIKSGDILYDMGSGDGRVVIEAAKKYGIRGVGVDLNPDWLPRRARMRRRKGSAIWSSSAPRTA
jgi:Cyclopropane fatty acid synthase and related methyltransferases